MENNSSRWKCGAEVEVRLFTGIAVITVRYHARREICKRSSEEKDKKISLI
jgi:hypothetical protein